MRKQMHVMQRAQIMQFVRSDAFGRTLCRSPRRSELYDFVAKVARWQERIPDVVTTEWTLWGNCLDRPVNLQPRSERPDFTCLADVYSYEGLPENSLVVDFANRHVGGGCFGRGFVQEEQMVMQSTDFAAKLHQRRERIGRNSAISYQGMHIDAWWNRDAAAKKESMSWKDICPCSAPPLTILAVDAPHMRWDGYTKDSLGWLAKKVLLIFEVAEQLDSPVILSGLLGGGAFRNNRPLVLLLHLLLQPFGSERRLLFHYPVFWSFCGEPIHVLEQSILSWADVYLQELRRREVRTLEEVLRFVLESGLALSHFDRDLKP